MSRSVKKNPVIKDNGKSKKAQKTHANRIVRRKLKDPEFDIADGKAYKKEFESWNIADYVSRWTKEDAIKLYNEDRLVDRRKFPTLEKWLEYWEKCMIKK